MTEHQLAGLRAQLVAHLKVRGDLRTERVAAAFERVPRHLFVPDLAPEDVYTDRSIAIKLQVYRLSPRRTSPSISGPGFPVPQ